MSRILSERTALERLNEITSEFRAEISGYERRAKDCLTCEVQGSCCLDAHFVNVRITRIEAVAISKVLHSLPAAKRDQVIARVRQAVDDHDLSTEGDPTSQTFACPLFERGVGCLVHKEAKPSPCIAHACYASKADLPPDELLAAQEDRIEHLNQRTYGRFESPKSLPVALERLLA